MGRRRRPYQRLVRRAPKGDFGNVDAGIAQKKQRPTDRQNEYVCQTTGKNPWQTPIWPASLGGVRPDV